MNKISPMPGLGLVALKGEAQGNGRPAGKLAILPPSLTCPPLQSSLLTVPSRTNTLICAGYNGMRPLAFYEMLRAFRVRRIVDIRLFAIFGRRGFRHDETLTIFRQLDIEYFQAPELANPFHVDPNRMDIAYREHAQYLESCTEALQWLLEQIRKGPLVLIDCDAEHLHSGQQAVLDALLRIDPSFDVRILNQDDFCREDACQRFRAMALEPPPPAPPEPPPKPPKTHTTQKAQKTRSKTQALKEQTKLPFG